MRLWELKDKDLPEEFFLIRKIFLDEPESKIKPGETIHDYLIRENKPCFCSRCRKKRKKEAEEKNEKIV